MCARMREKLFSQLFLRLFVAMSLLRYFEPINRLPTPEEARLSANTTQAVNQAVEKAVSVNLRADAEAKTKKRKYTVSFTPEDRAMIGKYAAESGNAAAVMKFKASHHDIRESTVRLFMKRYLEEVKKRQVPGTEFEEVTSLPQRKRGRRVMLGKQLDSKIQNYIKALRNAGTPIGSSVVMAAAEGLVGATDRSLLVECGGHNAIS